MESILRQEIIALPLSLTAKQKLLAWGYYTLADLDTTSVQHLTHDLGLTVSEALAILRTDQNTVGALLAGDLLASDRRERRIITFSSSLDKALDGGIRLGRVTEFCGVPGIGKTQLALQLCIDVTIPSEFKGVGGSAIFIDTEGSFSADRAVDMSEALVKHLQKVARESQDPNHVQLCEDLTVDSILDKIHRFRIVNCEQQIALMKKLPEFILEHPEIQLVVFDSISFHFRHGFKDMGLRTRLLSSLAQAMMSLAERQRLAIVYTNQVLNRVYNNQEAELVAALGDSWGQCVSTRIRLYWKGSQRNAFIHKASDVSQSEVPFDITREGIRTVTKRSF